MDNYHFYRAGYFFGEPRLEKDWLGTFELDVAGGSTNKSINNCGQTVPLFDLYGPANMRVLGNGVPNKSVTNVADLALINLSRLPANDGFAQFSFPGHFSIVEADINIEQNFTRGFFTQIYIPIRKLDINPCHYVDLSPTSSSTVPNQSSPVWQNFLNQFDNILEQYNLSLAPVHQTCIGDVTVLAGWTRNYQNTKILDFVDATVKIGVLINSAPAKNEDLVFDIAPGYDKHFGFPISLGLSLGSFEWLTVGVHADVITFLRRNKDIRMKTDFAQNGILKLAKGLAKVSKGPIWDLGMYAKADHLASAFSLLIGYAFATQEADRVCPFVCQPEATIFNAIIVNSDETLKGWQQHNLNFLAEYDFTKINWPVGPRIGLIINAQVGGRKIFKTNMFGGYAGIDVAWNW